MHLHQTVTLALLTMGWIGAVLSKTKLSGADLSGDTLSDASLRKVDLLGVQWDEEKAQVCLRRPGGRRSSEELVHTIVKLASAPVKLNFNTASVPAFQPEVASFRAR